MFTLTSKNIAIIFLFVVFTIFGARFCDMRCNVVLTQDKNLLCLYSSNAFKVFAEHTWNYVLQWWRSEANSSNGKVFAFFSHHWLNNGFTPSTIQVPNCTHNNLSSKTSIHIHAPPQGYYWHNLIRFFLAACVWSASFPIAFLLSKCFAKTTYKWESSITKYDLLQYYENISSQDISMFGQDDPLFYTLWICIYHLKYRVERWHLHWRNWHSHFTSSYWVKKAMTFQFAAEHRIKHNPLTRNCSMLNGSSCKYIFTEKHSLILLLE